MTLDPPSVSVIIPTLNDAEPLKELLSHLRKLPRITEIRVADGGSQDGSEAIVAPSGAVWIESEPGRGRQMNAGATGCSGEILWFLHADSVPHPGSVEAIVEALEDYGVVGGAFRFQLSEARWYGPLFHFFIGLRSNLLRLPYGDQGYFVRKDVFESLGGFSAYPIMEDVDFIRRLRRAGKIVLLQIPIGVSPRRWDKEGVARRTLLNWAILFGYFLGIAPKTLERFYRNP